MEPITSVLIEADSNDAAEAFVREYALDAVDRLPKTAICGQFHYIFQGHPDEPFDRRCVRLIFHGDADAIIEQERSRWESYIDDGMLRDWERLETIEEGEIVEEYGQKHVEYSARLAKLETDFAKRVFEEFEDLPAPVDNFPDETDYPLGWWALTHNLLHRLNYDLEDELDVYCFGIEHTLRNYAEHDSPERADEELDRIIERLEDKREVVKEGRWDS